MNDKHREFNENDLLERISEGLDISESDYNKAVSSYTAVGEYLYGEGGIPIKTHAEVWQNGDLSFAPPTIFARTS
jgi:hypothetical protein